MSHIHKKTDVPFVDLDPFGRFAARQHPRRSGLGKPLPFPGIDIATVVHALGASRHERRDDLILPKLRARARKLHHAPTIVRIHDHARQTIRLAMHETHPAMRFRERRDDSPIGRAGCPHPAAPRNGSIDNPLHVDAIRHAIRPEREHPHADLTGGRPAAVAERATFRIADRHRATQGRGPLHPLDRPREDPRMPPFDGTLPPRPQKNLVRHQNSPCTWPVAVSTSIRR